MTDETASNAESNRPQTLASYSHILGVPPDALPSLIESVRAIGGIVSRAVISVDLRLNSQPPFLYGEELKLPEAPTTSNRPRPTPMINPTDPYRDNPALQEIADLQQRLRAATAECAEWREAEAEASRLVCDGIKTLRECMSRAATCGALSTASAALGGYLLGAHPESPLWLLGAVVASLAIASAVTFLAALRVVGKY